MKDQIVSIAADTLRITDADVREHCKYLQDIDAYYCWNPVRGGISVIINDYGEKLAATSSVSLEKHKKAFVDGRRN